MGSYTTYDLSQLSELEALIEGASGRSLDRYRGYVERHYTRALRQVGLDVNQDDLADRVYALSDEDFAYINRVNALEKKLDARIKQDSEDWFAKQLERELAEELAQNAAAYAPKVVPLKPKKSFFGAARKLAQAAMLAITTLSNIAPQPMSAEELLAARNAVAVAEKRDAAAQQVAVAAFNPVAQAEEIREYALQGDCNIWPVEGQEPLYTGLERGKKHTNAIDIRARPGKRVLAMCSGTVTHTGVTSEGFHYLRIDTGRGMEYEYMHADPMVREGMYVQAGQPVARIRRGEINLRTGEQLEAHLHVTVTGTGTNNTVLYPVEFAGQSIKPQCVIDYEVRTHAAAVTQTFTNDSIGKFQIPRAFLYENGRKVRTVSQVRADTTFVLSKLEEPCREYAQAVVDAHLN